MEREIVERMRVDWPLGDGKKALEDGSRRDDTTPRGEF